MTLKVIVFDFDGTIADTLDPIVNIVNRLAVEFGYKLASQEDVAQLQNLTSIEIIKQSGISIFKVPFFIKKLRAELKKEIPYTKPILGMKETLIELKKHGYQLAILTSNSKENVMEFSNSNGLQEVFDFIYTGAKLFGKNKVINKFLKQENFSPEEFIYVGDETRDIEAAKKSQVRVIAVSWGFNSKEILAEQNPDFLVQQPEELLEVIKSL